MAGEFDGVYQYVPVGFVHAFEALGWKVTGALNDTHHAHYSALMKWAGEGEAVFPTRESEAA